jgi:hypothetical protein
MFYMQSIENSVTQKGHYGERFAKTGIISAVYHTDVAVSLTDSRAGDAAHTSIAARVAFSPYNPI